MNLVKRLTILIFVILLCCPPLSVFAAKVPPLDVSDVMDDLQGLKIGDEAFNADTYLARTDGAPELLGMYEYGWGTDLYALYFYIYVPDQYFGDNGNGYDTEIRGFYGYIDVFRDTKDNQPISTKSINLTILDISDDGHFFKCKVDPEYDLSVLSNHLTGASSRIYLPELYMDGDDIPQTADPYGRYDPIYFYVPLTGIKYFTYTTTSATIESSEIINLTVKPSMYKTDFSPKGDYWHQMVYTAYFTIPKKYIESYDAMTGIKATWEEYHTAPLVVTEDDALLTDLQNMTDDLRLNTFLASSYYTEDLGCILTEYDYTGGSGSLDISSTYVFSDSINAMSLSGIIRDDILPYAKDKVVRGKIHTKFDTVLKVSDMDDFYIPAIGRYYDTDGDGVGDLAATFQSSVDDNRFVGKNTHNFTSEKDIISVDKRFDDNWIRSFFNSRWYPDSEDVEATLEPFYYLKDEDMTGYSRTKVNDQLFIGDRFWSDFYDTYVKAKVAGDQVVLFRFALRDYYSAPARYIDGDTYTGYNVSPNCALSYGTAFLDFDIIKLTFSKDAETYEFMVDADPIDFVPGGFSPNTPGLGAAVNNIWEKLEELFQRIAKIIGGALIVVVVIIVFKWLLDWLALRRR